VDPKDLPRQSSYSASRLNRPVLVPPLAHRIGHQTEANFYCFAQNNAISFRDPLGLDREPGWTLEDCKAYARKTRKTCYDDCSTPGWIAGGACIVVGLLSAGTLAIAAAAGGVVITVLVDRCKDQCNERYDRDIDNCEQTYGINPTD
jgi:hypothetical protein